MRCGAERQAMRHHTEGTGGAARHAGCGGQMRPCVTARRRRQGRVGQVRECTGPAMPQHTYAQRAHNTHSPARLPLPVGRHPGLCLLVTAPSAHHTTPHNTTPHHTAQHNTTQHNTTQHNTTQHNTTQHNTTQHNTTQHNTIQHNTTQHNTAHHNTTQHNTNWGWRGAIQWQLLSVDCSVRSCRFLSVRPDRARGAGGAALLPQAGRVRKNGRAYVTVLVLVIVPEYSVYSKVMCSLICSSHPIPDSPNSQSPYCSHHP